MVCQNRQNTSIFQMYVLIKPNLVPLKQNLHNPPDIIFYFLGAKMSSLTRYSSYERLMLGKQKLIECSSMQAFEKFKLEDKELKESLNSSMYASGVHGLSKCWSDGDENHLQEGEKVFLINVFVGKIHIFWHKYV